MDDTELLFQAAYRDPANDAARLVLADKLDEVAADRGEPIPTPQAFLLRLGTWGITPGETLALPTRDGSTLYEHVVRWGDLTLTTAGPLPTDYRRLLGARFGPVRGIDARGRHWCCRDAFCVSVEEAADGSVRWAAKTAGELSEFLPLSPYVPGLTDAA